MSTKDLGTAGASDSPGTRPYDPAPEREKVRSRIAMILVGILAAVFATVLLLLLLSKVIDPVTKDVVALLLASAGGLVGTVLGFYFAQSRG